MQIATMANRFEAYLREIGYGMLDLGTCGADPEDVAAAAALCAALRQRLAERSVL